MCPRYSIRSSAKIYRGDQSQHFRLATGGRTRCCGGWSNTWISWTLAPARCDYADTLLQRNGEANKGGSGTDGYPVSNCAEDKLDKLTTLNLCTPLHLTQRLRYSGAQPKLLLGQPHFSVLSPSGVSTNLLQIRIWTTPTQGLTGPGIM